MEPAGLGYLGAGLAVSATYTLQMCVLLAIIIGLKVNSQTNPARVSLLRATVASSQLNSVNPQCRAGELMLRNLQARHHANLKTCACNNSSV